MKLAAISGVNGVYTDADIQRVRELALQARGTAAAATPPAHPHHRARHDVPTAPGSGLAVPPA
jgi:hypothetical protein